MWQTAAENAYDASDICLVTNTWVYFVLCTVRVRTNRYLFVVLKSWYMYCQYVITNTRQACYWGFYKIWSTRPSPRPNLSGRNCPLSVMGVKVSLVCSNSTVFSPHGHIFPTRWSNQLNQSERVIYVPLAWISTDPGNGLVSSLCQAIAWTNFDL